VADHVDAITRSKIMKAVPTKNTSLEIKVRKLLTHMGFRYRLHRRDLPGTPDIVFPGRKKAIFVNGCFWHQHSGCHRGRPPNSRAEFWGPKLARNVANDTKNLRLLMDLQWRVLVVWECQSKDLPALKEDLMRFLSA
jgi:DNA mismatch endonuclease (patch repair protein)